MSKPPKSNVAAALEALLFVQTTPLPQRQARQLLNVSEAEFTAAVKTLETRLKDRGIVLVSSGQGLELAVAPQWQKFTADIHQRAAPQLSQSSLEVLAIIAYDGPVSKHYIDEIRGIASDSSLRALLSRDLIIQQKTRSGSCYDLTSLAWRYLGIAGRAKLPAKPKGQDAAQ